MTRITIDKALLEQAMRAIFPVMEYGLPGTKDTQQHALQKVYAGLTVALAEPAVEPVAWGDVKTRPDGKRYCRAVATTDQSHLGYLPLYASPPPAEVPMLTDAEAVKSLRAALAEPAVGPVNIDQIASERYKVVPAHESMFHRWAVVAGDGTQQLYLGRKVECQNMVRKFAGAFLDGAYLASQPADVPLLTDEEFESILKIGAYQSAEACRSGKTKAKILMQATEAAVRKKAGLK